MCGTLVVGFVQIERLTHVQQSDIPKLLNASGLDSKLLYPYSIITGERLLEFAVTCFSSLAKRELMLRFLVFRRKNVRTQDKTNCNMV